jgi:nitrite reductase (cytochrome c-552)
MSNHPTTDTAGNPSNKRLLVLTICVAALVAVGIATLLVNVAQHKQEAKIPFFKSVELTNTTEDPSTWGKDFPLQYDQDKRNVEMKATKYGGSEPVAHTATTDDPRTVVTRSKLEQDPRLKVMWAGYAFSKDYRERRGHAFMLEDQTYTERQKVVKQPGTCINCHASLYTTYMKLGDGDLIKGFEKVNQMPYFEARKLVSHPVACIDCHDPQSMELRITRPAFIEGIRALKASQGIPDFDVNKMATHQEMRSYVCAQCHVEYYFKGAEKRLVFPWAKGLNMEQIVAYYDEEKFKDWVHADTGAPMLKAQHPEFEMWSQGIHARSDVTCADCHMPYKREGALKVSDHHIQSPLLEINRSCQTCHRWPESELKARVEQIQDRFVNLRSVAMDSLMDLIADIKTAKNAGATDADLAVARDFQRKASYYIDMVQSDNSAGFHAPQEEVRVLADAINFCREGQLALRTTVNANVKRAAVAGVPQGGN